MTKKVAQTLTIQDYDEAQAEAQASCRSNYLLQAAMPVTFTGGSYPVCVREERELVRFICGMNTGRARLYYDEALGGFTRAEFELLRQAASRTLDLTGKRYGCRQASLGTLIGAVFHLRSIQALFPEGGTILEAGPGSGLTSALLAQAGYGVMAVDITQGFYLAQNHLFHAFGLPVAELATDPRPLSAFGSIAPGSVVHVPWWKYMLPSPDFQPEIDCVVANGVLAEMAHNGLVYNLQLWRRLFDAAGRPCALFCHCLGAPDPVGGYERLEATRKRLSFVIAYGDARITVYTTRANAVCDAYRARTARPGNTDTRTFASDNLFQARLESSRANLAGQPRVGFEEVAAAYEGLCGEADNDDERFLGFLNTGMQTAWSHLLWRGEEDGLSAK
ncbi:MAG: hypothetical protein KKA55_00750 [Proteobacteria bacterium]|nr:hypothetical protein [Pseudomonadota bacterium]MBU1594045.1 hypothetical protein [Pseudomonadota bacterium]